MFRVYFLVQLPILLSVFSGCLPAGNQGSTTKTSSTTTVKEWIKLDNSLFGTTSPAFYTSPIVSKDKKWLYQPASGFRSNIMVLDIGSDFVKNAQDKSKWTKLVWDVPSFTGAPGKARFSENGQIQTLNPAQDGLLLAWDNFDVGGSASGAFYIKGKSVELVWPGVTNIGGFAVRETFLNFFTIEKNATEVPYILWVLNDKAVYTTGFVTHPKLEAATFYTRVGGVGAAVSPRRFAKAEFAQNEHTAFLVSKEGISQLEVNQAGTTQDFSVTEKNTPVYGSDAWNMGNPTMDNNNIESVLVHDGLLYIGLTAPHSDQGGVAILDIANKTIIGPKKAIWEKIIVKKIITDKDGKVWAVTLQGLIEVKKDGTMGEKLNAQVVSDNPASYVGHMPSKNIFGAVFMGDTLFLAAGDQAYLMVSKQAK